MSTLLCEEKVRYPSRKKARDAVKAFHRAHARAGVDAQGELMGLNVYRCPEHECWHVGHKPGTSARLRAKRRAR